MIFFIQYLLIFMVICPATVNNRNCFLQNLIQELKVCFRKKCYLKLALIVTIFSKEKAFNSYRIWILFYNTDIIEKGCSKIIFFKPFRRLMCVLTAKREWLYIFLLINLKSSSCRFFIFA